MPPAPQSSTPRRAPPASSPAEAQMPPAGCVGCRPAESWRSTYREVLRSTETRASGLGLVFLATGWVMAGIGIPWNRWCYLAAAVVGGLPILRTCAETLRQRRISVEVLVALAIAASLAAGQFHAGAVVAVMLLGGGVLEQITVARARRSLATLLVNLPERALVRRGGQEVEVPVSELRVGDRVITRPGERVAVDGVVRGGESAVDESPITGESVPVDKGPGAKVFAGSINQSGALELEAQKVGDQTTLARILKLVEEAQAAQAPIQRVADRAAQWYVPTALSLAVAVWALTGQMMRGITVLIVFCPCALVLATPTAIIASIGRAARRVILVKGGQFAEAVGRINVVGLDKTGTLTVGRPRVTEIVALNSEPPATLLRWAASAERFSEHPLSVAIRQAAEAHQVVLREPSGFRAMPGCGVEAQVEGRRVLVGRLAWLGGCLRRSREPTGEAPEDANGVPPSAGQPDQHRKAESDRGKAGFPALSGPGADRVNAELQTDRSTDLPSVSGMTEAQRRATELEGDGHTVLAVALNGEVAGLIAVRDGLRPEARAAVAGLNAQGIRVAMLTGDNERVARAIAAEAGIEEVHARLLPEDKLAVVRQWQQEGERVGFIGDGINDAPALAAADIGIAMGAAGTDVALETADIAFLNDDLMKLPEVVALSRRTLAVIWQNIGFSVLLNLLAVMAAGLGWISPIGGAVIHESGAMAVILNAVRLLR